MTAPQRLTDRKREAIVAAAIAEFRANGFEVTSMDKIAATAGVSKRTVYNHFPSKEELFAEILHQLWSLVERPPAAVSRQFRPTGWLGSKDALVEPGVMPLPGKYGDVGSRVTPTRFAGAMFTELLLRAQKYSRLTLSSSVILPVARPKKEVFSVSGNRSR